MTRHTLDKIKIFGSLSIVGAITLLTINPVGAAPVTIRAVVDEMLTVSLENTTASSQMESDGLVRNKVSLVVATNNQSGFTASMTTADATGSLHHSSNSEYDIPLIGDAKDKNNNPYGNSVTRSAFPSDTWGFSTDDTAVKNDSSTYKTIAKSTDASPSFVTSSNTFTPDSGYAKDIYFGAKSSRQGTYNNSVIISVVSGVNTGTPDVDPTPSPVPVPDDPITPTDDTTPNDEIATYIPTKNITIGTTSTSTGTTTKTVTQMTKGDTRSNYTDPQGVTNTVASINEGTPLATGLAVTAAVAATTGVIFFVIAKRKKDQDDDGDDLDY